jgi:2-keto-3-deoxy-L-rhamnonate aldolase RhmA
MSQQEEQAVKSRNVLRELLDAGKPTIGTHVFGIWPGMVEVIGQTGSMNYIEFSGTYAPHDLLTLENFGRAVDLFDDMSSLMKLDQEPRTYLAVRALGSGIQNLLFADVRSVEDAKHAIASGQPDTPKGQGLVGAGMRRDVGYVHKSMQEYVDDVEKSVVALMIEKKGAVANLEEILELPGLDMVQFGAGDYSMSIGMPGNYDHPDVVNAEMHTIKTAIKMGVRPRVEILRWEKSAPYIEMGVKDFCIGVDVLMVADFCKDQGGALAKALGQ